MASADNRGPRGPFEHLEMLEQVAVHVDDLEASMAVYLELGVDFLPIMRAEVDGDEFRLAVSSIGLSLVETRPEGLRAMGFKVRDLPGIVEALGRRGIEPVLEFAEPGYMEAHFLIDNVQFSFAEYLASAPARATAAIVAGILNV
jgi:hypothetical protein